MWATNRNLDFASWAGILETGETIKSLECQLDQLRPEGPETPSVGVTDLTTNQLNGSGE